MRTRKTLLAFALVILAGLGCSKKAEDISTEVQTKQAETKKPDASRYASTVLSPEVMGAYNWSQQTPLNGGDGRLIGVKVPATTKVDLQNEVSYLIVHMQGDVWGDVIEHRIKYTEDKTAKRNRPATITSRNLISNETATKPIGRNREERPEKGGAGIERKSLVAPGGSLPLITIVGTYSDGSAGGQFTVTSPADYILIAGAFYTNNSGGGNGINNYGNLDYLDPLWVPSQGGGGLPGELNLLIDAVVNGYLIQQTAFPGRHLAYPWRWWESSSFMAERLSIQYSQARAEWLLFNFDRCAEFERFNARSYDRLNQEEKTQLATAFLEALITNLQFRNGTARFSHASLVTNPWMQELFMALATEIGLKVLKKYIPGYGDWQSIKDALDDAGHGDWLGALGEVLNIVKKKVPVLAVLDAIVDVFDFGILANKAWKVFDKLSALPPQALGGLLKTVKDKSGDVLGKLIHDDQGSGYSQAFVQYPPAQAMDFFQEFAKNLNVNATPTSNGAYIDFEGFRINFYLNSTSPPHGPSIEFILPNGRYKLRFVN